MEEDLLRNVGLKVLNSIYVTSVYFCFIVVSILDTIIDCLLRLLTKKVEEIIPPFIYKSSESYSRRIEFKKELEINGDHLDKGDDFKFEENKSDLLNTKVVKNLHSPTKPFTLPGCLYHQNGTIQTFENVKYIMTRVNGYPNIVNIEKRPCDSSKLSSFYSDTSSQYIVITLKDGYGYKPLQHICDGTIVQFDAVLLEDSFVYQAQLIWIGNPCELKTQINIPYPHSYFVLESYTNVFASVLKIDSSTLYVMVIHNSMKLTYPLNNFLTDNPLISENVLRNYVLHGGLQCLVDYSALICLPVMAVQSLCSDVRPYMVPVKIRGREGFVSNKIYNISQLNKMAELNFHSVYMDTDFSITITDQELVITAYISEKYQYLEFQATISRSINGYLVPLSNKKVFAKGNVHENYFHSVCQPTRTILLMHNKDIPWVNYIKNVKLGDALDKENICEHSTEKECIQLVNSNQMIHTKSKVMQSVSSEFPLQRDSNVPVTQNSNSVLPSEDANKFTMTSGNGLSAVNNLTNSTIEFDININKNSTQFETYSKPVTALNDNCTKVKNQVRSTSSFTTKTACNDWLKSASDSTLSENISKGHIENLNTTSSSSASVTSNNSLTDSFQKESTFVPSLTECNNASSESSCIDVNEQTNSGKSEVPSTLNSNSFSDELIAEVETSLPTIVSKIEEFKSDASTSDAKNNVVSNFFNGCDSKNIEIPISLIKSYASVAGTEMEKISPLVIDKADAVINKKTSSQLSTTKSIQLSPVNIMNWMNNASDDCKVKSQILVPSPTKKLKNKGSTNGNSSVSEDSRDIPVCQYNIGNSENYEKLCVTHVYKKSLNVTGDFSIDRINCFLYGVPLYKTSLVQILTEGMEVLVSVKRSSKKTKVKECCIEAPLESPEANYDSLFKWCQKRNISDNINSRLLNMLDFVPKYLDPFSSLDIENKEVIEV